MLDHLTPQHIAEVGPNYKPVPMKKRPLPPSLLTAGSMPPAPPPKKFMPRMRPRPKVRPAVA
eukprot:4112747-Lingulodinium_polyedra.AAC.1